ncbi:MFS transporter [Sporolactobacillus shoreicorticis]|uniref:MFS transporter n=1 Tax=Sporolactobacillus shoreicorticis TaxID=1923877 RepID=A0ABW5S285_9BACL|nr:MFS transporter [Sporolactobacillus shoreicorticis]MCO7126512.1 MFS transporter [Sporolactobacillus shoreicorticis]
MKNLKKTISELHTFLIFWITQSFSVLGSEMTNFALVIWVYQQHGSALMTALLTICSYFPYILLSIFAGALSDQWNKKWTMLVCDSFAALCSATVLVLLTTRNLELWHLYLINALNGLMNTVQQPASEVTISLLISPKHYQKVSGIRSLSNSLITVLTPALAAAMLAFTTIQVVIFFDLMTFSVAFIVLLGFIKISNDAKQRPDKKETVLQSAKKGLNFLKKNRGILDLILFLSIINFTVSIFSAALPAMILSRTGGGKTALGMVNTFSGLAMVLGSILVTVAPTPKSRVRVIFSSLLFSMGTENFILAFGRSTPIWCLGAVLGWLFVPVMTAQMDILLRSIVPVQMQGRVYSVRNTLQFFTIPVGYFCGGFLIDTVFEPFMMTQASGSLWHVLFGMGRGSGAALLFLVIGILGLFSCFPFLADKKIWNLEKSA